MLTFLVTATAILLRKVYVQLYQLALKHPVMSHLGLDKPLII